MSCAARDINLVIPAAPADSRADHCLFFATADRHLDHLQLPRTLQCEDTLINFPSCV
jgi:hypothetical protein